MAVAMPVPRRCVSLLVCGAAAADTTVPRRCLPWLPGRGKGDGRVVGWEPARERVVAGPMITMRRGGEAGSCSGHATVQGKQGEAYCSCCYRSMPRS